MISNVSSAYTIAIGQLLNISPIYTDIDFDTLTYNNITSKGTFNYTTGNFSWTPQIGDNGTYNWQINVTDQYGSTDTKQFSVSVNSLTPGIPNNLGYTTGNFWINYTWNSGVNTDSFNTSQNGTWTNGTMTNYSNVTLSPHNWSNISISGYNSTALELSNSTNSSVQLVNNAPTAGNSSISAISIVQTTGIETITLNDVTDLDNDTIGISVSISYGGTPTNYTMTRIPSTNTFIYNFSSGVVGFYDITNFYISDGYTTVDKSASHLFEVATTVVIVVSGGGGGGGGVYIPPTPVPTDSVLTPLTILQNLTDIRSSASLQKIGDCLSESLLLNNECSKGGEILITEPANWYIFRTYAFETR